MVITGIPERGSRNRTRLLCWIKPKSGDICLRTRIAVIALLAIDGLVSSCGEDSRTGPNVPPTTTIESLELLPQQQYRAHIEWSGDDPDGRVSYYEVAWQTGQVMLGPSLFEDELTWEKVTVSESTFTLNADLCSPAGTCSSSYTFFVRAVDNGGAADTNPPYESFTTTTVLPQSWFEYPSPPEATEPACLRLVWDGSDADGEVAEWIGRDVDTAGSKAIGLHTRKGLIVPDDVEDRIRHRHAAPSYVMVWLARSDEILRRSQLPRAVRNSTVLNRDQESGGYARNR